MRYGYWDTEWETEIFCHFRPCLSFGVWICHHFTYLYQKSQPYDVCFLRYKCNRRNSFVIFYTFTPLLTPKIKVWKKCKKTTGDIIFLQMCTINEDHMVYGSWDIRHDRQSFLSSRTIFCLLTLLTTQKIKILKKWKTHTHTHTHTHTPGDIIILHLCPTYNNQIMHSFWDMEHNRQNV